jgi:hypothetical protein
MPRDIFRFGNPFFVHQRKTGRGRRAPWRARRADAGVRLGLLFADSN